MIVDYNNIEKRYKYTFFSTLIIGFLTHGMALVNVFSIHDNVGCLFNRGGGLGSGRWLISVISQVNTHLFGTSEFSTPFINGILALIFIAISSCILVWLLDIKRLLYCMFIGGILVTFPTIVTLFGYMFTADIYMLSFALAILGAVLICKYQNRKQWLLGIILLASSVGIYQAFIPVIMSVTLLYLMKMSLEDDFTWENFYKEILKLTVSYIFFMAVYLLMTKFFLYIFSYQLTTYKGANAVSLSPLDYFMRIPVAYKTFIMPNNKPEVFFLYGTIRYAYTLLLVFTALLSAYVIKIQSNKKRISCIAFTTLLFLLPLCLNFMYVMCPDEIINSLLQIFGIVFLFIYNIWLLQILSSHRNFVFKIVKFANITILLFLIVSFWRLDNFCYLKAKYIQQQAISYFTNMASMIKNTDGYKDTMPVVFYGQSNIADRSIKEIPEFELVSVVPYFDLNRFVNDYSKLYFMHQWCGYAPDVVEEYDTLQHKKELSLMPSFPSHGSIRINNDTIYVKLGELN